MSHPSLAYMIVIIGLRGHVLGLHTRAPLCTPPPPDEVGGVDWWPIGHLLFPWPFPVYAPFHAGCSSGPE